VNLSSEYRAEPEAIRSAVRQLRQNVNNLKVRSISRL